MNANGVEISGRTWGDGPPIYFLNGLNGTCDLFALSAWLFREDFRCVFFDYAASNTPRGIDDIVEDVFTIADHHGDNSVMLYGAEFGAMVALSAMKARPERVSRAVLQSAFARRRWTLSEKALFKLVDFWQNKSMADLPTHGFLTQQNNRPWFPPFDFGRWKFFADNVGSVPVRDVIARARMLGKADLRKDISQLAQPVYLVYTEGVGSRVNKQQQELESQLPNVQSEWLHTCGALPFLTHPHRLKKLIYPFLTEETLMSVSN